MDLIHVVTKELRLLTLDVGIAVVFSGAAPLSLAASGQAPMPTSLKINPLKRQGKSRIIGSQLPDVR